MTVFRPRRSRISQENSLVMIAYPPEERSAAIAVPPEIAVDDTLVGCALR